MAAATAAASTVKKGIAVYKVDIKTLQKVPVKIGSNLKGSVQEGKPGRGLTANR